jgi:hypothetical protein
MTRRRPLTDSPFDTLEATFRLLSIGPRPLAFDGTRVPGLPRRAIALAELRSILLHPSTDFDTRDTVVADLAAGAQTEGGARMIGLAGVLLPGLRRAVWSLCRACPGKVDDIEAEALACFVAEVARCQPDRPRLAARLCWLARTGAKRVVRAELSELARPAPQPVSAEPPRPFGHPDFVLADAVTKGVLDVDEAELIGATRIGDVPLAQAAAERGLGYWAAQKRRKRAEYALVAWLASEEYPDPPVQESPGTSCSCGAGRPRQGRPISRRPEARRSTPPPRR